MVQDTSNSIKGIPKMHQAEIVKDLNDRVLNLNIYARGIKIAIILLITFIGFKLSPWEYRLTSGLCILWICAAFWLTEVIDLSVTALLVPLLSVLLLDTPVKSAFSEFSHPIIFLFLGGFALAAALKQQGIDQWLANKMILLAKGNAKNACLLLCCTASVLSMWISSTAVTAMLMPLVLSIVNQLPQKIQHRMGSFALLGIAYSASIGGMATIVGTGPNAIAAAYTQINFAQWLEIGLPISVILFLCSLFWLNIFFKPASNYRVTINPIEKTRFNSKQTATIIVFFFTVIFWVFGKPLGSYLGILKHFDAFVVMVAIIPLASLGLLDFKTFIRSTQWDILLLFGGSFTLGQIIKTTGVSGFLATHLSEILIGLPTGFWIVILVSFVIFFTELTSNTASTALLVPIFLTMTEPLNTSPELLATLIALSASCAYMLPIATPPNAMVYASGYIKQKKMMQAGFVLNCVAILVMGFFGYIAFKGFLLF